MHSSINRIALRAALSNPGTPQANAAHDLPPWITASLTYDVDEVLLLEVLCWRPGRSPSRVMGEIADHLSALGWREQANGPLPWHRSDGVGCAGGWITWTWAEVARG